MLKRSLLALLCAGSISISIHAQPTLMWTQTYNGPPDNGDHAVCVKVDAAGNSYVTGSAYAANGSLDIVTIKYDGNGQQLWIRSFNGSDNQNDQGTELVLDNAGNVYVTGYTTNLNSMQDITTIKYNTNGVLQWVAYYDGSFSNSDQAAGLAVDANGNVFVTGYETSANNYTTDMVTVKYNSSGLFQWGAVYDGPGHFNDQSTDLALDANGDVYVVGSSDTVYNSQPNSDIVLLKYDNSGNFQYRKVYDSPTHAYEYAKNVTVDDNNGVVVSGYGFITGNGNDYFLLKWDAAGAFQWYRNYNFGPNLFEQPNALVTDSLNNVIVTGQGIGPSSGSTNDYVTVKYDASGNFLWAARYNNIFHGEDRAQAVALDDSLNIYVTGFSKGTGTGFDIATIKYDPAGNQQYVLCYDNAAANLDDMGAGIAIYNGDIFVTGSSANLLNDDYVTLKYSYGTPLSVETVASLATLSLYPNPVHDQLHIQLPADVYNGRIEILDVTGRVLLSQEINAVSGNEISLSVAELPSGLYFVNVYEKEALKGYSRFIVE